MTTDQSDPWLNKSVWDVSAAVALLLGLSPEVDGHGFVYIDTPPYRPIAPIVGDDRVEVCSKCSTEHKYAPECPKCGYVYPHRIDWHQRMKEIRALAYEDIDAGKLPYLLKRKDRRVAPRDFCQWADRRGYAVPDAWRAVLLLEDSNASPSSVSDESHRPLETVAPTKDTIKKRRQEWIDRILRIMCELDSELDPNAMPGVTSDFQRLCQFVEGGSLFHVTLSDGFTDAKQGRATFRQGHRSDEDMRASSEYYRKMQIRVKERLNREK